MDKLAEAIEYTATFFGIVYIFGIVIKGFFGKYRLDSYYNMRFRVAQEDGDPFKIQFGKVDK